MDLVGCSASLTQVIDFSSALSAHSLVSGPYSTNQKSITEVAEGVGVVSIGRTMTVGVGIEDG